jgi:hypothetical protein
MPTGPQPLLYALGLPGETLYSGSPHAVSWSLTTAAGTSVPGVKMVDNAAISAYGFPQFLNEGGVMVPPSLTPNTTYHGSVDWQALNGSTYTQTFAFHTLARRPALQVVLDVDGGAGVELASNSTAMTRVELTSVRAHRVAWSVRTAPGTLHRPRWIPLPSSIHGRYELCAQQSASGIFTARATCANVVSPNRLTSPGDWGIDTITAHVLGDHLHLTLVIDPEYRGIKFSYRTCVLPPGEDYGPCHGPFRNTRLARTLHLSDPLPVANAEVEVDYKVRDSDGYLTWAWAV